MPNNKENESPSIALNSIRGGVEIGLIKSSVCSNIGNSLDCNVANTTPKKRKVLATLQSNELPIFEHPELFIKPISTPSRKPFTSACTPPRVEFMASTHLYL